MEKNEMLRAALAYAARFGWPIFPIKPRAKTPLTKHGHLDATTDLEQIERWWKQWPNANIAVATGKLFWVLDIDPRNGGDDSLQSLIAKYGALPDTLQQITGGGGRQYFFAAGEQKVPCQIGLLPGIDVKGEGGYVLLPPSVHPSGGVYTWDGLKPPSAQSLLPGPAAVLLASAHPNGHRSPVELPEQIKKGVQHETLFRLGCFMRNKGFEQAEIFAALWEANQKRCEKPGPRANIEKLAASICSQFTPGERPAAQPNGAAAAVEPLVCEEAVAIYNSDYPDPEPLVDPILYAGLTILGGRPKAGKSWLALQLALAFVTGQKFAGYLEVRKPGRCLYLSLEERPRQTRYRLRQLTTMNDFLADLHFIFALPALLGGGAALLDQELAKHPSELLIVDSLLAATKQADRKNVDVMQADYNIVATFRQLAEKHRLALVLVAHTRKAPGEFLDSIQGTSGTTAAADAVWVLGRSMDGDCILNVTGREVRSNVFGLKRRGDDDPAWLITGEGDEVTQSEERREILELLREQGPMKPLAVARAVRKNVGAVQRLMSKLYELNLIVKTKHGTYQVPPDTRPTSEPV